MRTFRSCISIGFEQPSAGKERCHQPRFNRGLLIITIRIFGPALNRELCACLRTSLSGRHKFDMPGGIWSIQLCHGTSSCDPHAHKYGNRDGSSCSGCARTTRCLTILTTVHDANQATGSVVMQLAITTHEHLYLQNLLFALGLTGRCVVTGAPMTCPAWYGNYMLQLGIPFPARNGQGVLIQMHRRPTFQDHRDSLSLLQTRTELTSRVRPTHRTVVEFSGRTRAIRGIDMHCLHLVATTLLGCTPTCPFR